VSSRRHGRIAAALVPLALMVAACQGTGSSGGPGQDSVTGEQIRLMQAINKGAQNCWRRDQAFAAYRFIPELDTRAGKPRLLVVRANAAQGLPHYVIQAEGSPARLAGFGPLEADPLAIRIRDDIGRWSAGDERCRSA